MAEVDNKFNLKDWEWIAVHFPPSEREAMAKVAWLICCRCTPEEIYRRKIDPRIVIPLCGIVLLDKKDFLQLKKLAKEEKIKGIFRTRLEELEISIERSRLSKIPELKQEYVNEIKQGFRRINFSKKWEYLFETLDIDLQFALLCNLIKYRRPTRDDWRNIFLDVEPDYLKFVFLQPIQFLIFLTLKVVEPGTFLAYFLRSSFYLVTLLILINFICQINIRNKATNPLKHIFTSDSF
ncbi:hypothetical protein ACP6PL_28680 [Dapis sp. BLCC M126]|uniref:hypothetical protein n=1 Tax=Dapis sp. BLCC M126 TaxID=3400189 RepID=UPI003CEE79F1